MAGGATGGTGSDRSGDSLADMSVEVSSEASRERARQEAQARWDAMSSEAQQRCREQIMRDSKQLWKIRERQMFLLEDSNGAWFDALITIAAIGLLLAIIIGLNQR